MMLNILVKLRRCIVSTLAVCFSLMFLMSSVFAFNLGPTNPGKWGDPTMGSSGGTVTWSLMDDNVWMGLDNPGNPFDTFTPLSSFMPVGFKSVIEAAFDTWSAVADIQFMEVADGGEYFNAPVSSADIRIGGQYMDGRGGELAHAYFAPQNGVTASGDIHFDNSEIWNLEDGGPGYSLYRVALHEIGHSIGLDHEDSIDSIMGTYYSEAGPLGLYADDIAGAQFIYGAASSGSSSSDGVDDIVSSSGTGEPVPEPCTIALLGIGVLGILGYEWRRRKMLLLK